MMNSRPQRKPFNLEIYFDQENEETFTQIQDQEDHLIKMNSVGPADQKHAMT